MKTTAKRAVIGALAATMALTSFNMAPAVAAPAQKPATASKANVATPLTDVSTRRKRYHAHRGASPAQAMAMFGMVAGTIAAISASRRHRHHYGYYQPYGYAPYGYGHGYAPYGYGYRPYGYW
jgi:hypothetical protein